MTDMVKIPSMRPEPERDSYGRYVLPDPATGRKASWTRATTLKDALKDKEGLIGWKQRMAAVGLARMPHLGERVLQLHEEVLAFGKDWRAAKETKEALKQVLAELHHAAGGDEGSERGTQAHTLTEYADAGRLDEVRHLATEAELADLQAYLDRCDQEGIIRPPRWIERVVLNLRVKSAGTLDRFAYLRDGRLVCADVKSQADFDFGFLDAAAQMGQYVNADAMWNDETLSWEPLPTELDRKTGLIMHVPVGKATCELYEVDLVQGWEAAQVAFEVRLKRSASKSLGRVYVAPRGGAATDDRLLYLIRNAGHPDALTALWRGSSDDEWTDLHTQAACARKAELTKTPLNTKRRAAVPIGTSAAPYAKFENTGDRFGGEIVDFRVVQNSDQKVRRPLYLQEPAYTGKWEKTFSAFAPDGRPNDPICQWEITVDTGVEDSDGDTERRIFIDPRKGRRGTTVEGKKGGDAIAIALKKAKAHRVGLEIGGQLFVTFDGKIQDGDTKVNTWSAEYEPPADGPGTGTPVNEMPWLVGGARYDKVAELAKWEAARAAGAAGAAAVQAATPTAPATQPAGDDGLAERQAEALRRIERAQTNNSATRDSMAKRRQDEEPPF